MKSLEQELKLIIFDRLFKATYSYRDQFLCTPLCLDLIFKIT